MRRSILRNEDQPGGICSPIPRPFLFAKVSQSRASHSPSVEATESPNCPTRGRILPTAVDGARVRHSMAPKPGRTSTEVFPRLRRRSRRSPRGCFPRMPCWHNAVASFLRHTVPAKSMRSNPFRGCLWSPSQTEEIHPGNTATIPRGSRLTHSLGTNASAP